MSTKSRCNKIRALDGFEHLNHTQALDMLKMFGPDILAMQRVMGLPWEGAAERVLRATGLHENGQ
jgi:hypothetical protein